MRILTPDSNSRCKTTSYGWKYSRLGRSCSGSLDRLVLGHLCTDRPQTARIRIARTRESTFGPGSWEADRGEHVWGTAAKQQQVSHARATRAPATRRTQHRGAAEAAWAALELSACCATVLPASVHVDRCVVRSSACIQHAADETSQTPSPTPHD